MVLQIGSASGTATSCATRTGDPWGGRTLEWATASPPPFYNFAHTPVVHTLDAFAYMKERGNVHSRDALRRDPHAAQHRRRLLHGPAEPGAGLRPDLAHLVAGLASFVGMIVAFIVRSFDEDVDYYVPIAEVERIENERHTRLAIQG